MPERRARPLLYGGLVVASVATLPVLFAYSLLGGLALGIGGAAAGAAIHARPARDHAVTALGCGLALLVGPALYVLVAVTSH